MRKLCHMVFRQSHLQDNMHRSNKRGAKSGNQGANSNPKEYLLVLQRLPDIVYQLDKEGYFIFVNNSISMLGYTPKELIGKHFSAIVHPDDIRSFSRFYVLPKYKGKVTGDKDAPKLFDERRTGKRGTKNLEIRLLPKKALKSQKKAKQIVGKVIAFADISSTGYYSAGVSSKRKVFLGTLGIIRDITKQKQTNEQLIRHKSMLEISRQELKQFSQKVLSIREDEKRILSANLHSELGSLAVTINSYLSAIESTLKRNSPADVPLLINESKDALKRSFSRLKRIAVNLRPPDLDILGLPSALRAYFAEIRKQTGIRIHFGSAIRKGKIEDNTAIIMYRIAQEAVTNVIKHAHAEKIRITLSSNGDETKLTIHDDGKGVDTQELTNGIKMHMGLRAMKEMVEYLNGTFKIESILGKGTKIKITIPAAKAQKS
jgi:PAS domain S-box-containing protein